MNKFFKIIFYPFTLLGITLIYIYKYTLNLILPSTCIYYPTCSTYTLNAIHRFGIFKGCFLGVRRIFRCRYPFQGGFDPVPDGLNENLKFIV